MCSQRNVSDVTTTYINISRSEAGFSLPCFNFPPLPVLSVSNRPTRQVRVSTAHTNRDQSLIRRNRWWSVYLYIYTWWFEKNQQIVDLLVYCKLFHGREDHQSYIYIQYVYTLYCIDKYIVQYVYTVHIFSHWLICVLCNLCFSLCNLCFSSLCCKIEKSQT